MNHYIETTKDFVIKNKKWVAIGAAAFVVIIVLIAAGIYSTTSLKYTYQPVKSCDLFTPTKAQDLLGDKVIGVDSANPVVNGDVATSKCSYTNGVANNMVVAAIAVQSPVYDNGVQQNKTNFATAKSNNQVETVTNVGDSAFFNKVNGQLNVLSGRNWIIFSYGVGTTPEANTIDDAVKLAKKVLN